MSYRIIISKRALKELEPIPSKSSSQIISTINNLSFEPRPTGCKKLKGQKEYFWRIRVGNYRIIYVIEDVIKIIEIRRIAHRKDIYNDL